MTLPALLSVSVFAAEDALVLPKGIFRARIVGVQTAEISENFNAEGKLEPFALALNRSVTVKDFMAQSAQLGTLVGALNALQPGLGNGLMNSNLYTDSRLNQRIVMPALEYGITSKLTAGIRVPIVTRDSRNAFRADSVNNAQAIASQLGSLSPALTQGLLSVDGMSLDTGFFADSLFTSKGYEAPHDFNKTEVGDIETGLKYQFYRNAKKTYAAAAQWGVRLPTGSTPSLTHVFDKGSGGGSYATALQLFQDVSLSRNFVFGTMVKGMHFFSDTRARAVPKDANDALPSLLPEDGQVRDTTRKPGLLFESELALTGLFFEEKFSFWGAYQFGMQGESTYEGPGNLYYAGLSEDTSWRKQTLELGASLYTVPWYRAKQFPFPARVNLIYSTPLAGVNAPLASFVRTDLIVFF